MTQRIIELLTWWEQLPPDMAFFFAIPFIVAAAALAAHGCRSESRKGRDRESLKPPQRPKKMNANAFRHRH